MANCLQRCVIFGRIAIRTLDFSHTRHACRPETKGGGAPRGAKAKPPSSNFIPPLKFSEMLFILLYLVYFFPQTLVSTPS